MNGREVLLDVATDNVRAMDRGAGARTERLRGSHRNHGRAWSGLEESELRRMWGEGVSLADLVKHFGRSPGGIRSALLRLGLVQRVPLPRER